MRTTKFVMALWALGTLGWAETISAQNIQWASEVVGYSTELRDASTPKSFAADQALGKPSRLPAVGYSGAAWAPAEKDRREGEWIELRYAQPMQVAQVAIAENCGPGAVIRIQLMDELGAYHEVYSNPSPVGAGNGRMFCPTFPLTPYKVKQVRIDLNTYAIDGANQIDAVGISDSETPWVPTIHLDPRMTEVSPPEHLERQVNSEADEILPVISPNGKELFFTRQDHPENIGNSVSQDIWRAELDDLGDPSRAVNVGAPLNNSDHSSLCSLTPDGQTAIVLNVYNPDGTMGTGVSMTTRNGETWSFPKKIEIANWYNRSMYGEYCIAPSGNILIMTLQRDDSYGNKDIYFSTLKEDGTWTEPQNMGPVVNTAVSETSPFLAADGLSLYYSTSGLPGYGSNDMFVTRRLDNTWKNWSDPINLGPVLNTPNWDAYYSIPASGEYAYFVSSREGSYGKLDIFRVEVPKALRPRPVVLVNGRVLDDETGLPIRAEVVYEDLISGEILGKALSAVGTGKFSLALPAGRLYGFHAVADGYAPESENIQLDSLDAYKEVTRDLRLAPIREGAIVRMNNIFFDFGKFNLRKESMSELKRVKAMMDHYPGMIIKVMGHTDDIGSDENNLKLSINRAKSVLDYLVGMGIPASRLQFEGLGEKKPEVPNVDDYSRQRNRRVEFLIVKI